jgi:DNA-binding transcriptional MerR regulator
MLLLHSGREPAMKVTELAHAEQVNANTVRHYVRIGLLNPARDPNGYHSFAAADQQRLRFILQARDPGFTLDDIKAILHEAGKGQSPCPAVRQLIEPRLKEAREKLKSMQALVDRMEHAVASWEQQPDCQPCGEHICHLIEGAASESYCSQKECDHE